MSAALTEAIYARLSGAETLTGAGLAAQQALAALLATDDTGGPAIIQGNGNQAVVYPCITFRQAGGMDSLPGHDFGRRVGVAYDLEVWEARGTAETIVAIDQQIELLLDCRFRACAPVTMALGKCYWMGAATEMDIQFDHRSNSWYGLRRFVATEGRSKAPKVGLPEAP